MKREHDNQAAPSKKTERMRFAMYATGAARNVLLAVHDWRDMWSEILRLWHDLWN
jgi:hypothetical protein